MPGKHRSRTGIETVRRRELQARALELRKAGLTVREIAERLGVGRTTVHRWLVRHLEELAAETRQHVEAVRALELERLDALQKMLWHRAMVEGDLRAVDRLLRVAERRARLLGLDLDRVEVSGPGGGPIEVAAEVMVYVPDNGRGATGEGDPA